MKRFSSAARLALAIVAVLGLTRPVAAGEQVPLKGGSEGEDIGRLVAPPIAVAQVTAAGNATQLGQFTFLEQVTVNTATGAGSGSFQFTAANGDTVYGSIVGQARLTAPGVLTILETATIEGGTGRFEGATGSISVARVKNLATGETACTFEGTISSPGS